MNIYIMPFMVTDEYSQHKHLIFISGISSMTNKLYLLVSSQRGRNTKSYLIDGRNELDLSWL